MQLVFFVGDQRRGTGDNEDEACLLLPARAGCTAGSTGRGRPRHLPVIVSADAGGAACAAVPGAGYQALTANPPPSDRPAEQHADLNLALRSYTPTSGYLGLVDYGGAGDPAAPQLAGLFADRRTPAILGVDRVYDWNWGCNCRGAPLAWPDVTLARPAATPGEVIALPAAGYQIGLAAGYQALVLYASAERITLKYTRDDNVVSGYTIHLEGLCTEPSLLALYTALNAAGRGSLPALRPGQAIGRAREAALGVAVRDNGTFLDPRSRKDWWQGK